MGFPKTLKGLSNRITKIRTYLSETKREYGWLDDSGGLRYELAYLYFLLDDNRRSSEYMRWFDREFPDDTGEPFQLLCRALMLHRMKKTTEAEKFFVKTMCSNIYMVPSLLDMKIEYEEIHHSIDWAEPGYVTNMPDRLRAAITPEDTTWIRDTYHSMRIQEIQAQYLEIEKQLVILPPGEKRKALVTQKFKLAKARMYD